MDIVLPEMIDDLVGSKAVSGSPGNAVIMFAGVKNRAVADFNIELIDRTVGDLLLRSGKLSLMGDRGPQFQAALDLLEYKPDDLVTRATARSLAAEAGSNFLLVANIHPAVHPYVPGKYSQTCFRLALHLFSAETGEWVWNDEKDFRFRR